jgi:hypothetical protein
MSRTNRANYESDMRKAFMRERIEQWRNAKSDPRIAAQLESRIMRRCAPRGYGISNIFRKVIEGTWQIEFSQA